jgi:hypothetical protein
VALEPPHTEGEGYDPRRGDPGKGKSTILYDLAARITSGRSLSDGEVVERGAALIVSAEDGAADAIVPRFLAAGGDPKRARIIGSKEQFIIPDDLDKLERTAEAFVEFLEGNARGQPPLRRSATAQQNVPLFA